MMIYTLAVLFNSTSINLRKINENVILFCAKSSKSKTYLTFTVHVNLDTKFLFELKSLWLKKYIHIFKLFQT